MLDTLLNVVTMSPDGDTVTLAQIVGRLVLSILLGLPLSLIHAHLHREHVPKPSFARALILLPLVACAITLVIGSHLVRAFGLIGAVALVRFRTVIKDTLDMTFVFFAITLGMASGTALLGLGTVVLVLFALTLGAMELMQYGKTKKEPERFVVSVKTSSVDFATGSVAEHLNDVAVGLQLDRVTRDNGSSEYRYRMALAKGASEHDLLARVAALKNGAIQSVQIKKE